MVRNHEEPEGAPSLCLPFLETQGGDFDFSCVSGAHIIMIVGRRASPPVEFPQKNRLPDPCLAFFARQGGDFDFSCVTVSRAHIIMIVGRRASPPVEFPKTKNIGRPILVSRSVRQSLP